MSQSFKSPTTVKAKARENIIGESPTAELRGARTLNSFLRQGSPGKDEMIKPISETILGDLMFKVQQKSNDETDCNDNMN